MPRRILEEKITFVNGETGEITKELTKTVTIKTGQQEEFFMLFVRSLQFLFDIKSLPAVRVLVKFCELAVYNTGTVYLPTNLRTKICEELGMGNNQLSNIISYLKKQGVITGGSGVFDLNPKLVWKGDLRGRKDALKRMKFDFKIEYDNRSFDANDATSAIEPNTNQDV